MGGYFASSFACHFANQEVFKDIFEGSRQSCLSVVYKIIRETPGEPIGHLKMQDEGQTKWRGLLTTVMK